MTVQVPNYRVLHRLGEGGMGSVFLAVHTGTLTPVAVKVPHEQLGQSGLARLQREANLLLKISSPHIPHLREVVTVSDLPALVMEFVEGEPLSHRLSEVREPGERLGLLREFAPGMTAALRALHEVGVVHRDVKPQNILLVPDRGAVLVDLGLAWTADAESLTKTGATVGTLDYIAPEQLQGGEVGPESDLYQLGLVCMDILCGREARRWGTSVGEAMRRTTDPVWQPNRAPRWVPGELSQWMEQALEIRPSSRPAVAPHLCELEDIVESLGRLGVPVHRIRDSAPSPPDGRALASGQYSSMAEGRARGSGRNPLLRGIGPYAVVMALMILALVGSMMWSGADPRESSVEYFRSLTLVRKGREVRILRLHGGVSSPPRVDLDIEVGGRTLVGTSNNVFTLDLLEDPSGAQELRVVHPRHGKSSSVWLPSAESSRWITFRPHEGHPEAVFKVPVDSPYTISFETSTTLVQARGHSEIGLAMVDPREGTLRLRTGSAPSVEVEFSPAETARKLLAGISIPRVDLRTYRDRLEGRVSWSRWTFDLLLPEDRAFFVEHGPLLAACLGLPTLDEGLRYDVYRQIAPYRILEQSFSDLPRDHEFIVSATLGPLLSFGTSSQIPAGFFSVDLATATLTARDTEIGTKRALMVGSREDSEEARVAMGATDLDVDAVEIGLRLLGGEPFSAVECVLPGDKRLLFPLGGPEAWVFHRMPASWWTEGRRPGDQAELRFRMSRLPGAVVPASVSFDYVLLRFRDLRDPKRP